MKKTLIIARHGNTFLPSQTPTRVGRGTDLPLVEEKRGRAIGKYLLSQGLIPTKAYAAPLKRTLQTAQLALEELKLDLPIASLHQFLEIDYGLDENKTEAQVLMRLGRDYAKQNNITNLSDEDILRYGKQIVDKWDSDATVPNGWTVDVDGIINSWSEFAGSIGDSEVVLLCSSNGIIRFAPHILDIAYPDFCSTHDIKVATGSVSVFEFEAGKWTCKAWNTKAYNLF